MSQEATTVTYAVTPDGDGWRLACDGRGLGVYVTRAAAYEAAVSLAEQAVDAGGGRAEILCEAPEHA